MNRFLCLPSAIQKFFCHDIQKEKEKFRPNHSNLNRHEGYPPEKSHAMRDVVSWSNSPAKISLNHCILPAAKKYFTTANVTLFLTNKTHEVIFTDAGLN